jgi:hypothetical protein
MNLSMLLNAPLVHPEKLPVRILVQEIIYKSWLPVESVLLSLNNIINTLVYRFQIAISDYHLDIFRS